MRYHTIHIHEAYQAQGEKTLLDALKDGWEIVGQFSVQPRETTFIIRKEEPK